MVGKTCVCYVGIECTVESQVMTFENIQVLIDNKKAVVAGKPVMGKFEQSIDFFIVGLLRNRFYSISKAGEVLFNDVFNV